MKARIPSKAAHELRQDHRMIMHICTSRRHGAASRLVQLQKPLGDRSLDLELTKESGLLLESLETTVTVRGGGVDELEVDLLEVGSRGVGLEGFSEGDDPLLDTRDGTLKDDAVGSEDTVVGEATHGGERLVSDVVRSSTRLGVGTVADSVDLVVSAGSVVVTVLTGTGDREHDRRRVPSSDTGDLSETSVRLSGKLGDTPTLGNTLVTLTVGDGNGVDDLVLLEDGVDTDLLLEVRLGELDLVGDGSTVDLDLHEVGLLLVKTSLAVLGVGKDSDDRTVLLDSLELSGDGSTRVLGVLLVVSGESLLLGSVPVPACQRHRLLPLFPA